MSVYETEGSPKRGYADVGGGISAVATGLIINDCDFIYNNSTLHVNSEGGGGIYLRAGSDVTINSCLFRENEAYVGCGGGLNSVDCTIGLNNCEFIENMSSDGAALFLKNSSSIVSNCIITRNYGGSAAGGAMVVYGESLFENCIFYMNSTWYLNRDNQQESSRTGRFFDTGGLVAFNTVDEITTIRNCTFASNGWNQIYCHSDSTMVIENTIIAPGGSSIVGNPIIECTNIFGHSNGNDWVGDFEDQLGINGNISEDPLYCTPPVYPDFDPTLMDNSPCAPENSSGCGLIGACPVACYESAVGVVPDSELFSILSCYPNPFNPSTIVKFKMIEDGHCRLRVFDLRGVLVDDLLDRNMSIGKHSIIWQPENLSSGVYKVVVETAAGTFAQSVVLVK